MADFDIAASTYDKEFTDSKIGIQQRTRVWKFLDQVIKNKTGLKILELNCGTGEDAIMLAKKGNKVVATDISEQMLDVARGKAKSENIEFLQVDLNNINIEVTSKNYDLVFSNFGGLNCIDHQALSRLGETVSKILSPDGSFVAVLMPNTCLWEITYLTLKGKTSEAFRRNKEVALVNISGRTVKTWYYSPRKLCNLLGTAFKKKLLKPVGLFIPPSYMESYFSRHPSLLRMLSRLEKIFANFSWQAKFSDHFIIQLKLK